jgi:uncharacterized membrane protein YczE
MAFDMRTTFPEVAIHAKANCVQDRAMLTLRPRNTSPAPRLPGLADLGPVAQLRAGRLALRLPLLVLGLYLYGASLAMMVRGSLGLAPWDVLHVGVTRFVPLTLGQTVIVLSFGVLLLWIPLGERPGLGTVANAVLVGLSTDLTLGLLDAPSGWWARASLLAGGILLNALATGLYIGSQFGRGPRDGLMTGLVRRTGLSVRVVRTSIEVTVVALGWLLGGTLGAGTVLYALLIGPLVQVLLPRCTVRLPQQDSVPGSRSDGRPTGPVE